VEFAAGGRCYNSKAVILLLKDCLLSGYNKVIHNLVAPLQCLGFFVFFPFYSLLQENE